VFPIMAGTLAGLKWRAKPVGPDEHWACPGQNALRVARWRECFYADVLDL